MQLQLKTGNIETKCGCWWQFQEYIKTNMKLAEAFQSYS